MYFFFIAILSRFFLTFLSLSLYYIFFFFFSSRRRHTRYWRDWSSDVCSSDLPRLVLRLRGQLRRPAPREGRLLLKRRLQHHPRRPRPARGKDAGRLRRLRLRQPRRRVRPFGGPHWAHARHHHRRSEEQTSELQSRQYPVCRLLLEKK